MSTDTDLEYPGTNLADLATLVRDEAAVEFKTYGSGRNAKAYAVLPTGYELEEVQAADDEELEARPYHRTGTRTARDVESFVSLFDKHASNDAEVYADETTSTITAVLDGGAPQDRAAGGTPDASWLDNRVELVLQKDPDWEAWAKIDGQLLPQATFAEFLEQQAHNVIDPLYADLLEIAQSIEVSVGTRFKAVNRTSTGERTLVVDEEHQASAGGRGGDLTIPTELKVALRPWTDAEQFEVRVLFRYRLTPQGLALGVRLVRAEQLHREAWQSIAGRVQVEIEGLEGTDQVVVVNGPAPRARR